MSMGTARSPRRSPRAPSMAPSDDSSSVAVTPRRHRSGKASSEPALSPRSGKASSELGSQVGTFGTDDPRNSRLSLPLCPVHAYATPKSCIREDGGVPFSVSPRELAPTYDSPKHRRNARRSGAPNSASAVHCYTGLRDATYDVPLGAATFPKEKKFNESDYLRLIDTRPAGYASPASVSCLKKNGGVKWGSTPRTKRDERHLAPVHCYTGVDSTLARGASTFGKFPAREVPGLDLERCPSHAYVGLAKVDPKGWYGGPVRPSPPPEPMPVRPAPTRSPRVVFRKPDALRLERTSARQGHTPCIAHTVHLPSVHYRRVHCRLGLGGCTVCSTGTRLAAALVDAEGRSGRRDSEAARILRGVKMKGMRANRPAVPFIGG